MRKPLNPVLSDKIVDELRLVCMRCNKKITGYYASYQEGGTCSAKCMREEVAERAEKSRVANDKFCERFGL